MQKTTVMFWLALTLTGVRATALPLTPVSGHYKTLAAISRLPNPARYPLDTVYFLLRDASKGSFVSTRLRGVYLPADVPALLTIPATPAQFLRSNPRRTGFYARPAGEANPYRSRTLHEVGRDLPQSDNEQSV